MLKLRWPDACVHRHTDIMGEAHDYEELAQQMAENDRQVRHTPASPTPRVSLRTQTTRPSSGTGDALLPHRRPLLSNKPRSKSSLTKSMPCAAPSISPSSTAAPSR